MINEDIQSKLTAENTGHLLYHLSIVLERKMKRALDEIGITHTQFIILATTFQLNQPSDLVTQVDIANASMTDKMMVSKILRALEKKGWITRKEHPTDTRAKTISITENGGMTLKKTLKVVFQVEKDFFSPVEDKKSELNQMMKILIAQNQD